MLRRPPSSPLFPYPSLFRFFPRRTRGRATRASAQVREIFLREPRRKGRNPWVSTFAAWFAQKNFPNLSGRPSGSAAGTPGKKTEEGRVGKEGRTRGAAEH